jgi:hypothetical protein
MKVFGEEQRFDPRTGKPLKMHLVLKGWICDYCGRFHSLDEYPPAVVHYLIVESGESEAQFDHLQIKCHEKVNLYSLFADHPEFRYCQDWDNGIFCEREMVKEWVERPGFEKEFTLYDMMYVARLEMVAGVLSEGKYALKELKLEER